MTAAATTPVPTLSAREGEAAQAKLVNEGRARRWYAQHIGRTGTWDDLTADDQRRFTLAAARRGLRQCNAPDCGGDCLECFRG